jgi:monosaccharide-transporting ATPase
LRMASAKKEPLLSLRHFGRRGSLKPIDLDLAPGEILGLAGLLGSGRTETARLIFGIDHADSGEMLLDGHRGNIGSPRAAIAHRFGFCPEDRKVEAILPNLSVRENIVLALQSSRGWTRYVSRAKQVELAEQFIKTLNIKTPSAEQPIRLLSGGNQQKVILARWIASHHRLLLLDEPTRGIDVGSKAQIYRLMGELAAQGKSVVFVSSYLPELLGVCDTIGVMCRGVLSGVKPVAEWSEHKIIEAAVGTKELRIEDLGSGIENHVR